MFEEFKCCGSAIFKHFLDFPKALSCGTNCIPVDRKFKCGTCGLVNIFDMSKQPIIRQMHEAIKNKIPDVLDVIYKSLTDACENIESISKDMFERIAKHFEFLVDDIDVYIESMKSKLDTIGENFKQQLRANEDNLKLLVKFKENEKFLIDEKSVGTFDFNHYYGSLLSRIVDKRPELIDLDTQPFRLIVLNNGNILSASYLDSFTIYNSNFERIQKTKEIYDGRAKPLGLASDSSGNICVSNYSSNSILLKFDQRLEFKDLVKYECKKWFTDICVYDTTLYACLGNDNCVETFSLDLKPISMYYIKFIPSQIRVLKNMVLLTHKEITRLSFYKLPLFEKCYDYDLNGSVLANDKWFYVFSNNNLFLFDIYGELVDSKEIHSGQVKVGTGKNGVVLLSNSHILVCADDKKIGEN